MTTGWLLLSLFYSLIGWGMVMYGKRAERFIPIFAGVALMGVPYLFDSLLWMSATCILLMASPFLLAGVEG